MTKNEQYAIEINNALASLFDKENQNHRYNLDELDATEYFIGLIKACALHFNNLTGEQKTFLEFTHISNQLIVQDMMKDKKNKGE